MKKMSAQQLSVLALVISLSIILQGNLKLDFAGITQYGFSFIPNALLGVIFGPAVGFVSGAIADIIAFYLFPSGYPFFLGYTLSAALGPMLYGLFLHRKEITLVRVFIVVLVVTIFLNIGLGTLWVSILRGKAYIALLPVRLVKNAISLVLNTLILTSFLSLPFIQKMIKKYRFIQ